MEYKIGEVIELDGIWYQCIGDPYNECTDCDFCFETGKACIRQIVGQCSMSNRSDGLSVVFKRLEKLGEPFERNGYMYQEYKAHTFPLLMNGDSKIPTPNGFAVIIKQNKEEDMEEINNPNFSNIEKIGKNLKPFDLQAAKAGKPVCTRDGRKARIICFDRRLFYKNVSYPILALVECSDGEDEVYGYNEKGKVLIEDAEEYNDLVMLPEKKEGWVNLYRDEESKRVYCGEFIFSEREKAEKHYKCNDTKVATVPVNWEE